MIRYFKQGWAYFQSNPQTYNLFQSYSVDADHVLNVLEMCQTALKRAHGRAFQKSRIQNRAQDLKRERFFSGLLLVSPGGDLHPQGKVEAPLGQILVVFEKPP